METKTDLQFFIPADVPSASSPLDCVSILVRERPWTLEVCSLDGYTMYVGNLAPKHVPSQKFPCQKFPSYEQIIPPEFRYELLVDRDFLTEKIKEAGSLDSGDTWFTVTDSEVVMKGSSSSTISYPEMKVSWPVSEKHTTLQVMLLTKRLLKMLKALPKGQVRLSFNGNFAPMRISSEEPDGIGFFITMPTRS